MKLHQISQFVLILCELDCAVQNSRICQSCFSGKITHCRKKIFLNVWKLLSFIWPCLSLPSEEIGRITDGRNVTSQHTRVLPYKSINIHEFYHRSIIKSISRQIIPSKLQVLPAEEYHQPTYMKITTQLYSQVYQKTIVTHIDYRNNIQSTGERLKRIRKLQSFSFGGVSVCQVLFSILYYILGNKFVFEQGASGCLPQIEICNFWIYTYDILPFLEWKLKAEILELKTG